MKLKTWIIIILLTGLAIFAVLPLFMGDNGRKDFCEAFSDINGMIYHRQTCSLMEKIGICRPEIKSETFGCVPQ
jgi:hypothetical protein